MKPPLLSMLLNQKAPRTHVQLSKCTAWASMGDLGEVRSQEAGVALDWMGGNGIKWGNAANISVDLR